MQRTLFLILMLAGLTGCKMVTEEIKKTNKIRKITKEVCDCRYVEVDKNLVDGNGVLTLTLRKSSSTDRPQTAENIYQNLQEKYPNICNYAEVFIIFEDESDDFDERFTYYDCSKPAEHDSIFYEDVFDDFEDWDDSDWDEFMEDDSVS